MKEIKYKKVKPTFTKVLVTADKFEEDGKIGQLFDITQRKGDPKPLQTVLAVGSSVSKDIKVGDKVELDVMMYAYTQQVEDKNSMRNKTNNIQSHHVGIFYQIPTVEVDGKECFLIDDRCIKLVVEDWEEVETPKQVETPASKLILPNKEIIH